MPRRTCCSTRRGCPAFQLTLLSTGANGDGGGDAGDDDGDAGDGDVGCNDGRGGGGGGNGG